MRTAHTNRRSIAQRARRDADREADPRPGPPSIPHGTEMNSPYGRGDLMAMAAVRYCLGRSTYIVSDCADWLVAVWPTLQPGMQAVIRRDIAEAIERDDRDRQDGREHKHLGMDMDRRVWVRVAEAIKDTP